MGLERLGWAVIRWGLVAGVGGLAACASAGWGRREAEPVVDAGPDRLVFKPHKANPDLREYERGLGVRLPLSFLGKLDKAGLTQALKDAIAIRSESCQERAFAEFVIRKFQGIGVDAKMDGLLEKYAALPPEEQAKLACDDGKTPPNSGNVVAYIPPTQPDPDIKLPSYEFTFHLDTRNDPDLTMVERGGRFYSDGKTILGGDDKGGYAIAYSLAKFIVEHHLPHGGIIIKGIVAEEDSQVGGVLLDDEWKRADIQLVFDAARTESFYTAGPDIYRGSYTVEQNNWETVPPKPFAERFSISFEGSPQHPAFSHKGISAIGLGVEVMKRMETGACGTVKGHDEVSVPFRFLGGKLKEGTTFAHPEIVENGNEVPVAARIDFLVEGDTAAAVADYKKRLLAAAEAVTREATQNNEGGVEARFTLINEAIGEAPRPHNASAMMAHALMLFDYRSTNHPGGDPDIVFQPNQILSDSPGKAVGSWQLRSINPANTEELRRRWETALAKVTTAFHGTYAFDEKAKQLSLKGYKLPDDDPAITAVLGAYQFVGGPKPRVGGTFGGSTINYEVEQTGRGSVILMPIGDDFLHTKRENWDIADGYRALQLGLGTFLFLSQYGRSVALERPRGEADKKEPVDQTICP